MALLYKTFNSVQGYFHPRTDRAKSTYIHLADKVSIHRVNFTPEVPGRGRILRKAKLPRIRPDLLDAASLASTEKRNHQIYWMKLCVPGKKYVTK